MHHTFRSALVAVILFVLTVSASAPQLINYQATLTDTGGTPVADDTYSVIFTIYNADTGGESKWSETQSVSTINGQFAVLLGSINPIDDSVFNEPDRFLGLTVGADPELSPRARLATMPYGFRTATIDGASGGKIAGGLVIHVDSYDSVGNAISVIDTSGSVVLTITVKDNDVASVDFYDPVDSKMGPNVVTPIKLRLSRSGITFFGVDSTDTVFNISSEGDIESDGQLSVGASSSNSGVWAVSLGYNNVAAGDTSTITGGSSDTANAVLSTIGGGAGNFITADAHSSVICGGSNNYSSGKYAFIGGGGSNTSDSNATYADWSVVVGGMSNEAWGIYSTIGGGLSNSVDGEYATAAGGVGNNVTGKYGTVGGGGFNWAADSSSTVSGGKSNIASAFGATVGGGFDVTASGMYSAIGGGLNNTASGVSSTVGGGGVNEASADASTVGGGENNTADNLYSTVGGGGGNTASGEKATISGGWVNTANGNYSAVGGGMYNTASFGWATVGGGESNTASNYYSTVSGGRLNLADTSYTTIAGGFADTVSGVYASIVGGSQNKASGDFSFIGGGSRNTATGSYSVVAGGQDNSAAYGSFAAGEKAKATHGRSFVWSDGYQQTKSNGVGTFVTRASGGYTLYTDTTSSGVSLTAGSSAWQALSDSTIKRNIREVDYDAVLEKLARLPISQWSYKSQDESIEHIGPMAQDFYRLFGLGEDNIHISTLDPDGVALAAIKALYQKSKEVDNLKEEVAKLRTLVEQFVGQRQE